MHLSAAEIVLRSEDFYKQNDIEMKLGKKVSRVGTKYSSVTASPCIRSLVWTQQERKSWLEMKLFPMTSSF